MAWMRRRQLIWQRTRHRRRPAAEEAPEAAAEAAVKAKATAVQPTLKRKHQDRQNEWKFCFLIVGFCAARVVTFDFCLMTFGLV